ncbi:MAG: hypothetical protein ACE5IT_07990 [bacterium]
MDSKILAITGYDISVSRKKILPFRTDDCLAKPFETGELMKEGSGVCGGLAQERGLAQKRVVRKREEKCRKERF